MDTIVMILMNNKAYIGDIYKGKIKQIVFKKMDYWEIYHHHDFCDLIEYMNYPLNYNKFKNNTIKILYDNPKMYDYLYKVASEFSVCEGITFGKVEPAILAAFLMKTEKVEFPVEISFMDQGYQLTRDNDGIIDMKLLVDEEVTEESIKISVADVSALLTQSEDNVRECLQGYCVKSCDVEKIIRFMGTSKTAEEIMSHYAVFSPVTIYKTVEAGKKKTFTVEDRLLETFKPGTSVSVKKDAALITYEHKVHKWFGKAKIEKISMVSPITGNFFGYERLEESEVWAKRDTIIGLVSKEEISQAKAEAWLKEITQ
ncbi:MAG: hypothetical protein AB9856_05290 [Cellulosilyticaceae bacterium]